MTLEFLNDIVNQKMHENEDYINFSFYEIRVKYNLNEEQTNDFLELIKNKLENNGYNVFFTDDEYEYKGIKKIVQLNELLVAIKS